LQKVLDQVKEAYGNVVIEAEKANKVLSEGGKITG